MSADVDRTVDVGTDRRPQWVRRHSVERAGRAGLDGLERGAVGSTRIRLGERGLAISDHTGRIAYYDFVKESLETSLLVRP